MIYLWGYLPASELIAAARDTRPRATEDTARAMGESCQNDGDRRALAAYLADLALRVAGARKTGGAHVAEQPVAPVECRNNSPAWFTGRWRDWHRGHGCNKDDGQPRSAEGAAEIEAGGAQPGGGS